MAASRFRPPKKHTPSQRRQPRPGMGAGKQTYLGPDSISRFEREEEPILRVSRTGVRNLRVKQREALRKERKADPAGEGVHSWRRRQW